MKAFFISIPHSGERVPPETAWLKELPEEILMCDVDRYVDQLYGPVIQDLKIKHVVTEWHRYAADLNRLPEDLDELSVKGAESSGRFSPGIGLHWAKTTKGDVLMPTPMEMNLHKDLVEKYHKPFHEKIKLMYSELKKQGAQKVYQLDAHSMPSMGTKAHKDPGEERAEIVISDLKGQSCEESYKKLVIDSFVRAGFQVKYNWPYVGGRVTEAYGKPDEGQHCIQVEINRKLYMNEDTKQIKVEDAKLTSEKISEAVGLILKKIL